MKRAWLAAVALGLAVAGCGEQGERGGGLPVPGSEAAAVPAAGLAGDKPMLPAWRTEAEKKLGKGDQYSDYKDANPAIYGITVAPGVSVRPAAEYEPAQKFLITWSSTSLPSSVKKTLAETIKGALPVVEVDVVVAGATQKNDCVSQLKGLGVAQADIDKIKFLTYQNDSIWMRDYGPVSFLTNDGKVGFADFRYYPNRIYDDAIPHHLGKLWNVTTYKAPLDYEGGNFQSDTKGNCFASQGLLWNNGVSEAAVTGYMKSYLGCSTMTYQEPINDGTTHVDMFSKITGDGVVVVGKCTTADCTAATVSTLDKNATMFQQLGFKVHRIPMPYQKDGVWRTYTNSLFVNNVNLIPIYSVSKDKEAEAMGVWKQAMPAWSHVGILSDEVITWGGAQHCVTMTVPVGTLSQIEGAPAYACNGAWDCYPGAPVEGCGDVTYEGCCEGQLLKWCENNQLQQQDCSGQPQCGWSAQQQFYNCGTAGAADPSGQHPKACPGACTPSCAGKQCGPDGCGGSCGTCQAGYSCSASGQCVQNCVPNCNGKQCGGDGCGGSCGTCPAGYLCSAAGLCVQSCQPNCAGKQCGGDGCGGICGTCQLGYSCNASGQCVQNCVPNCAGKQCGPNGCGGSCGTCPAGNLCNAAGQCVPSCVPSCAGKQCGDDGCGGSCGTCAGGQVCQFNQCVAPQPCGSITWEGCCDGETLKYCEMGTLKTLSCASNPKCGWNATGKYYDCGSPGGTDPTGQFPKSCTAPCLPSCQGKQCGPDGCGGTCGTCGAGFACDPAGKCIPTCVPSCAGKQCGDDGCGGSCGTCAAGQVCQAGKCQPAPDPCLGITWEGCCDGSVLHWCEALAIQSVECGAAGCGWNAQQGFYDCSFTGVDPSGKYPKPCPGTVCIPNCAGKQCGDDGCGGSCGTCAAGTTCQQGKCVSGSACGNITYAGLCEGDTLVWCENNAVQKFNCTLLGNFKCQYVESEKGYFCVEQPVCQPACVGKECGDDGCGGSCGACPAGKSCQAGKCQGGACVPDCADKECGDDGCGGSCGACVPGWFCELWHCTVPCQPSCAGKECGDNGCGGSCGTCPAGTSCKSGKCEGGTCIPDCTGKECGDDGCAGSCGTCLNEQTCKAGMCVAVCQPMCAGQECGDDGCGGSCGACLPGFSCVAGMCQQGCKPSCAGKQCGDDGCGGSCGSCQAGEVCTNGTCAPQCIPNCVQKSCGDDGCGGSCGVCPKDFSCDLGKCMPAPSGCGNVTSAGLCDGTKLLKCVSGQVVTVDCAAGGKVCAYSPPAGVYDCVLTCLPNCAGKMCGEDGCGGSCGTCGKGDQCLAGVCEPLSPCIPDCAGRTCGDDGCGGSCGSCADGQVCKAGVCADEGAAECPDGQEWNGTECTAAEPGDNAGGSSGGCAVGTPGSNALTLVLLLLALGSILSYARRPGAGRA